MSELVEVEVWEMIFRTTLTFIVLLVLARIMGKKQISQLTFFHYVTGITIGSIAGNIAGESETPFLNGILSMVWWALLTLLMTYLSLKSRRIRIILDDQPTILIREGKILETSLNKTRFSTNDLNMMLREQGIFSITDVYYAILETNGELSVMKAASQETATRKDVKAPAPTPKYVPTEIIVKGKILKKNLIELDLTEEWVMTKLKQQGIGKLEQVLYAEVQTDGGLHVDLKSDDST
jgi:uncharacterized membrane protein YcaP (DUF421 family)